VSGSLAEISPASDPSSRTFLVRYDLETTAALVSGQFGRLFLPVGDSKELTIARSALVRRGQLEMVFVLDGDRARLRLVKSGRSEGDKVAILSGLSDGEKVLARHAELLQDGQRVTVQP
jgi:multidrug efflux pump subunit AcrA (membrane-fusion protein)